MLTLFTIENEKQNGMSFLDEQSISQNKKTSIYVYGKLTFCGVYTHFESFLTSTYMSGTVCTLACKCFQTCLGWTKLHTELLFLKQIFLENGFPENLMNKCFKGFMDNTHNITKATLTVEKKSLVLVLLSLSSISLKSRTKLKKLLK